MGVVADIDDTYVGVVADIDDTHVGVGVDIGGCIEKQDLVALMRPQFLASLPSASTDTADGAAPIELQ